MLNKYFFIMLFGLLTITLLGLIMPQNPGTIFEMVLNGFKIFGGLLFGCWWYIAREKWNKITETSFRFSNWLIAILACIHAYKIIVLHVADEFLVNSCFDYAMIIFYLAQYALLKYKGTK